VCSRCNVGEVARGGGYRQFQSSPVTINTGRAGRDGTDVETWADLTIVWCMCRERCTVGILKCRWYVVYMYVGEYRPRMLLMNWSKGGKSFKSRDRGGQRPSHTHIHPHTVHTPHTTHHHHHAKRPRGLADGAGTRALSCHSPSLLITPSPQWLWLWLWLWLCWCSGFTFCTGGCTTLGAMRRGVTKGKLHRMPIERQAASM
jgi:hypothetical protein